MKKKFVFATNNAHKLEGNVICADASGSDLEK